MTVNDLPIEYNIYGNKVYANTDDADQVVADYTYRANEEDWPSYFTLAVEYSLATIFATSIARDSTMASLMNTAASNAMAKARSLRKLRQRAK